MSFEDIKILGIDNEASDRSEPGSELLDVVLKLSASPPWEWADYFDARWKHELYMMKRRAYVSGASITITCVPSELESDHLSHLQAVIAETNATYRAHLTKAKTKENARRKKEAEDKAILDQLNTRLFKK